MGDQSPMVLDLNTSQLSCLSFPAILTEWLTYLTLVMVTFEKDGEMNETELFQMALGLAEPWRVVRSSFDVHKGRLDIKIDFPRGSKFRCPVCGVLCAAYDTSDKTWRHLC